MSAPQAKAKGQSTTAKSPGRPPFLTDVKRAEICAVVAVGCSYRTAAKYVGCTVQAISALAERDREFAAQLDRAVAKREIIPLSHIREASARSWRAAAWLLQYTVGGRYGGDVKTLEQELADEESERAAALIAGALRTRDEEFMPEVRSPEATQSTSSKPAAEQIVEPPYDGESPRDQAYPASSIEGFLNSSAEDEARHIAALLACLSPESESGPAGADAAAETAARPSALKPDAVLSESVSPQSILESMQALEASWKRRRMEA